jgi:hypothetical protein
MNKFQKLPTEEQLTDEDRARGFYMGKWGGLDNHRCIKCPYASLQKTEAELHYFYKHVMTNKVPTVVETTRPVEATLVDSKGAPITEMPLKVEGKTIVLPAGYVPPVTVVRHLEQAAEGPADNQSDGPEPRFKRR